MTWFLGEVTVGLSNGPFDSKRQRSNLYLFLGPVVRGEVLEEGPGPLKKSHCTAFWPGIKSRRPFQSPPIRSLGSSTLVGEHQEGWCEAERARGSERRGCACEDSFGWSCKGLRASLLTARPLVPAVVLPMRIGCENRVANS